MKIGLIDVDGRHYPNLALMKISAWHKARGDEGEWWDGFAEYDKVYMSKVFDETYTPDIPEPTNAKEIVKGGTGYGLDNKLPYEVEHIYPDYSIYPEYTKDTAYGFLTRGCPRACHFCIVSAKEGRCSEKVADLSEWWRGQKNIVLMDANILACPQSLQLLQQLKDSGATVDFNQGLDARLLNEENIALLGGIKIKELHFAWDYMKYSPLSAVCCDYSKKKPAKKFCKDINADLQCVGVRKAEGGVRAASYKNCFTDYGDPSKMNQFRPVWYLTDDDKRDYEQMFNIVHSRCYTEYGLRRTGCVGCPFNRNAEQEMEIVKNYEPKLYAACQKIFGEGYELTRKYRQFAAAKNEEQKKDTNQIYFN